MTRMIKWPSINQFRNVVKNVEHTSSYVGTDIIHGPIYNKLLPKPTLKFEGTVKLHGTNASVCFDKDGAMWCQSRENIITPEKDNAGFAMFVETIKRNFQDIATRIGLNTPREFELHDTLCIFGEWCGGSIQSSVALNQLRKMFVIFGIALVDAEGEKTYLTRAQVEAALTGIASKPSDDIDSSLPIYSIYDFETYNIEIDFENPHEAQNILNKFTDNIEKECPVGRAFGVNGIGEGCVWRCVDAGYEDSGFWFKVKGSEHSASKVKTLATVDVERINDIRELAERLAHEGRLEQGCQAVYDTLNGGEIDETKIGPFIKWVIQDIFKEELDTVAASGFTGKDISGPVSKIASRYILKKLEV